MEETTGLSKQQKKSMETKEKIFKAAKRILQRSGYETLSIKNICEEAGVSMCGSGRIFRMVRNGQFRVGIRIFPEIRTCLYRLQYTEADLRCV